MKRIQIILLLLILPFLIYIFYMQFKSGKEQMKEYSKLMQTNVKFEGKILNFRKSNNHAFGIVELKITHSSTPLFEKEIRNKLLYPYRIKDSLAEVYVYIPTIRKIGERVVVDSNLGIITYYNGDTLDSKEPISIILDETDIEFVKKNSLLFHIN